MQVQPYDKKDGRKCWLNEDESQNLIDHYSDDLEAQLIIRLLLTGLRKDDLVKNVRTSAIRQLQSEDIEAYVLDLRDTKRDHPRFSPISKNIRDQLVMLKQAKQLTQGDLLFTQSKRTIERIVTRAGTTLAEETGDKDWLYVRPHDLRRTWGTRTYYQLIRSGSAAEFALRTVCAWGGWSNPSTFEEHYLGTIPEDMQAEMMDEADLR